MNLRAFLAPRRYSLRWALLYAMAVGAAAFALCWLLMGCASAR